MYNERHGGPLDRGRADAWYNRPYNPHCFKGDTYSSDKVELKDMTAGEIAAYTHGYEELIATDNHKEY